MKAIYHVALWQFYNINSFNREKKDEVSLRLFDTFQRNMVFIFYRKVLKLNRPIALLDEIDRVI